MDNSLILNLATIIFLAMPISLTDADRTAVRSLYKISDYHAKIVAVTAIAFSIILAGSLVVGGCALSTLRLTGVTLYKLRALLIPSFLGIVISIPLIILTVTNSRQQSIARAQLITSLRLLVERHLIPVNVPDDVNAKKIAFDADPNTDPKRVVEAVWTLQHALGFLIKLERMYPPNDKKRQKLADERQHLANEFLQQVILKTHWSVDFRHKILTDLIKLYGKKPQGRDKALVDILKHVQETILKS